MQKRRVLALLTACLFLVSCLGGTAFAHEDENGRIGLPPGLAKKDAGWFDKGRGTVTDGVYGHPSLRGLMRAYENAVRNGTPSQAVLAELIRSRGGDTVWDSVYGAERVIRGQAEKIKLDADARAQVLGYLDDLVDEIEELEPEPQKKAQMLRHLARVTQKIADHHRAEVWLRQALRFAPSELNAYQDLQELFAELQDQTFRVFWDGDELDLDVRPTVENGRTLLPLRQLGERLGGTFTWDPEEQKITFVRGDDTIVLTVGNDLALVNGAYVTMDVEPRIVNGRVLVPVRFVAEELDLDVGYLPNLVFVRL